ncbi:helix-turn-helix transcriptional regulator [Lutispora thermophila]|uniref:Predicted DNA-binding transcriptional regulator YafY, contains an HTH and WYL domains n=1 Tax=Lutispora thermophila DSM 19022 TaxID=1122184 RepID=A0A1M6B753_9FIRM|nr:YafY family protein [Lutispora thermophila]SHI44552.1 Predicted DNA-binding transcriptional regulator YafY, contains an HTH and WYL domains [Lutispora thermophila DSM 19022]
MMKLDRLISVLVILLRKEKVQAKELARIFEVSVRTILRDVETLNLAGVPIVTYQGANGGIGIAEGYRLDKSVLTQDDMAEIISTLRGLAKMLPNSRHEVLMEKFMNTLSTSQIEKVYSKANRLIIDHSPWGEDSSIKYNASLIYKAIEDAKEIRFKYINAKGEKTFRIVEPYSLILKSQKWYLYGWCSLRKSFRLFKLSRMRELMISDKSFLKRELPSKECPWEEQWENTDNLVSFQLAFEKEMEDVVIDYFGYDYQYGDDGRILVNAVMPEDNWLYGFILSFRDQVEVISPIHIRTIIKEISEKIYKKYL